MSEIIISQLICFAIGLGIGVAGALSWLIARGRLDPTYKLTVPEQQLTLRVDWALLRQVVHAEGYQLIARGDDHASSKLH